MSAGLGAELRCCGGRRGGVDRVIGRGVSTSLHRSVSVKRRAGDLAG